MTSENGFEFLLVRHPPVSVSGVCYGHADVPASASDEEVAELALRLPRVSRIWTSTSSRCAELATRLAARLGASLSPDPRLREMCFGEFEGLTWTEIERRYPDAYTAWMGDWRRTPPPGGETLSAYEERAHQALSEIRERTLREARSNAEPSGPPLIVTHAGVIRALFRASEGLEWDEALGRAVPHLTPHIIRWKL